MAGGPIQLDGPWAGTPAFNPATPLDIATIESAIVAQLKAAIGNVVEVAHFPDKPENYRLTHRIGAALVIYRGSKYGEIRDIDLVAQERTLEFAVTVETRDLGWAYGGQPGGPDPGAYSILESIRAALTGFQPNTGCTKMAPGEDRFLTRDREGGLWLYEMTFMTRTVAVENLVQPNFPLLTKAEAFEEAGQTNISAPPTQYTFNAQNVITLPNQNLSAVIVSSLSGQVYISGTDYTLDAVNGIITRLGSGGIPANATVNVQYSYAEIVSAIAGGGSAPTAPTN